MTHLKDQSKSVSHFRIDIFPSHQCPRAKAFLAHEVNDLEEGIRGEGMIMPRPFLGDPICRVRVEGTSFDCNRLQNERGRKLTGFVSR